MMRRNQRKVCRVQSQKCMWFDVVIATSTIALLTNMLSGLHVRGNSFICEDIASHIFNPLLRRLSRSKGLLFFTFISGINELRRDLTTFIRSFFALAPEVRLCCEILSRCAVSGCPSFQSTMKLKLLCTIISDIETFNLAVFIIQSFISHTANEVAIGFFLWSDLFF